MQNKTTTKASITLDEIQEVTNMIKYERPFKPFAWIEKIKISQDLYTYLNNFSQFVTYKETPKTSTLFNIPVEIDLTLKDFNYKIIKKGEE